MASNMSTKIPIPKYNPEKKYEIFKSEIGLWAAVTDVPEEKQGACIILTLPDTDTCSIRSTVIERIDQAKINAKGGFKLLQTLLDELLGKDDLQDSVDEFDEFEDYHRTTETMREYIQKFDTNFNKLKNNGIDLPQEVLAFKLIRNAKISPEDKKLVMTGLNYDDKTKLYGQAKSSLKKYCGEGYASACKSDSVRYEPTTIKSEAFATNFTRGRGRDNYQRGRGRGFWPHQQSNQTSASRNWRGGASRSWRGGVQTAGTERPLNPPGADGKLMLCKGCGSYRHFLQSCPESWENLNKVSSVNQAETVPDQYMPSSYENQESWSPHENYYDYQYEPYEPYEPYVTLFTDTDPTSSSRFTLEAQNCAVLDTACASTVCGMTWFDAYVQHAGEERVKLIKPEGSNSFKFGAGPVMPSLGTYEIPVTLAGVNVKLITDVVDTEIPLLLSKTAMKKAGIVIDLNSDTAVIFGKKVPLDTTSSGHYCIPINAEFSVDEVAEVLKTDEGVSSENDNSELEKKFMKLHRQFGHPSQTKLKALLVDANQWNDDYKSVMDAIYSKCTQSGMCRFKKKILRPVAALPLSSDFNEKIAMDLKYWKGKYILHIVDLWSRFTISTFISRKKPTDVIHAIMNDWCSVFGVPAGILTDNGGEFINEELNEVRAMINIESLSTAAYSPFQNGTCERNHQVVDSILEKLVRDFPKTPEPVLLKWACMAKNTLQMYEGFSSHQLVFGRNPSLPNILTSSPSSLEHTTISKRFTEHLNSLHAARKAFIESESCIRIKRALKHKIRTNETVFNPGEIVYYKRDSCDRWIGPAKVIFQDGKVVFIRHGAVWVKVSPNRIVKSGREFDTSTDAIGMDRSEAVEKSSGPVYDVIGAATQTEDFTAATVTPATTQTEDRTSTRTKDETSTAEDKTSTEDETSTEEDRRLTEEDVTSKEEATALQTGQSEIDTSSKSRGKKNEMKEPERASLRLFNKEHGSDVYCVNTESPSIPSYEWEVFMSDVPKEKLKSPEVKEAKQDELKKLTMFDVYEEVDNQGQPLISTKWVVTYKGQGIKARIVARGFQEREVVVADSPTVAKTAFRTMLSVASSNNWCISTTDIKSAFLQGNHIDRDVYLKPPKEAEVPDGKIWKLKKSLYGLYDGARQFYLSVRETLLSLGCHICSVDPSLFFYFDCTGQLAGLLISHVDDFLHAGNQEFDSRVMNPLRTRFVAGKVENVVFRYVGFDVLQKTGGSIEIRMDQYLESCGSDPVGLDLSDQKLSSQEETKYRSVVGQLNWIAQGTRPDKAFDIINLSTKFKCATSNDLKTAKKMLVKLKEHECKVVFPSLDMSQVQLEVYTDAAHANLPDGISSTYAFVVFLVDKHRNACTLSWKANKIHRVVNSTLAAETLALNKGLDEAMYLRKILCELYPKMYIPIEVWLTTKAWWMRSRALTWLKTGDSV